MRFLANRGVDVRRTSPWKLPFFQPGAETFVSEDSLRLQVEVEEGEEPPSVVVDREGSVASRERASNDG